MTDEERLVFDVILNRHKQGVPLQITFMERYKEDFFDENVFLATMLIEDGKWLLEDTFARPFLKNAFVFFLKKNNIFFRLEKCRVEFSQYHFACSNGQVFFANGKLLVRFVCPNNLYFEFHDQME